ncbi:MAG: type II toxin-antitoxin system RelE/ParE family toxin [Elusimicrobiota bacterium]
MAVKGFEILFRPEVEGELKLVDARLRRRILAAIRDRLGADPERYGRPLGGSLLGLRRIRCGDYRVAYQVRKRRVVVWAVLHRKAIYAELERRLRRL